MSRRTRGFIGALGVASVFCCTIGAARAQCPEMEKFVPSTVSHYDHTGWSTALSGDVAVLGAPERDVVGTDEGAAWVYRFDGTNWNEEALLTGGDSANYDDFGYAVAADGSWIAIGAPHHDSLDVDAGAVYLFEYSGGSWSLDKKLTASDGGAGDRFGQSLAMEGDFLVVGAPGDDITTTDVGSAYVFQYQGSFVGWQEAQKLTAPTPAAYDQFGFALDMDDERIAVGVPYRDSPNYDAGAVLTWTLGASTWIYEDEFTSSTAENYDNLGYDVGVDGGELVAGLPGDDDLGWDTGSLVVFHYESSSWTEKAKLYGQTVTDYDYFGQRVDVQNGVIVAAVRYANVNGIDSGILYSYLRRGSTWYFDQPHGASTGAAYDQFGCGVALDDFRALTGAWYDDDGASDGGVGFLHGVGKFMLDAEPNTVSEGDPLTFTSACGTPGTPCWFAVMQINSSPYFQILFSLSFAADHRMTFTFDTPPGLDGNSITFATFKIAPWSKVVASNFEVVDFQ